MNVSINVTYCNLQTSIHIYLICLLGHCDLIIKVMQTHNFWLSSSQSLSCICRYFRLEFGMILEVLPQPFVISLGLGWCHLTLRRVAEQWTATEGQRHEYNSIKVLILQ